MSDTNFASSVLALFDGAADTFVVCQGAGQLVARRTAAEVRSLLSVLTSAEIAAAYAAIGHTHGNLSNAGAIGTTANLPIITGTSGVLQAGSFGTTAGTFCQGNDSRLSDARTPTAHTHTPSDITGFGEAVDDEVATLLVAGTNISITYNDAANTLTIASTASGGSPGGSSGQVQFNNAGSFGGAAAVVYAATGTHLAVTATGATIIPFCVKGAASQSANLQEWQNSSGTILASVSATGSAVCAAITVNNANSSNIGLDVRPWVYVRNNSGTLIGYVAAGASIFTSGASGSTDFGFRSVGAFGVSVNNSATPSFIISAAGNAGLFGAISAGGGVGVAFIANATTVPSSNPTGGGVLYVEAGALKYRGSSGTVTTLGPA